MESNATMAISRSNAEKSKVPVQETLRLSGRGAGMLLGDLEHALMDAAWALDRPSTAREIHERVVRTRPIELITAITVLNRLVKPKQLMQRKKIDDIFHYQATVTRDVFLQRASRHVVERVLALGADAVTSSFVDVLAERDPAQLEELGRMVRRKLRARESKE